MSSYYEEKVTEFIKTLTWSGDVSDYEKTLVIGNLRGFAGFLDEEENKDLVFTLRDNKEAYDEEKMLSILLRDEVLFCNQRHTAMRPLKADNKGYVIGADDTKPWDISEDSTTVLYVNCNDLFWWATADAESLPNDEIPKLYKLWRENRVYGPLKWCCLRRNLRPQLPIVERMKKDGYWDEELEALPAPEPS